MKNLKAIPEMQITKDEYVKLVREKLDTLTEDVAGELFVLGSYQDFTNDNDIFEAIHFYLGSLEVPVSDEEYAESIAAIKQLIDDYEQEKRSKDNPAPNL